MVRIGINGFGRIGSLLLRAAYSRRVPVVAVNSPHSTPEYLAYALKFDSVHGRFRDEIAVFKENLILNKYPVKLFHEEDPSKINWSSVGADYVAECSGRFNAPGEACKHVRGSVKRVVISAPAKGVPNMLVGVNLNSYDPAKMQVISCSSCTANALAPLIKVVHEAFGIEHAFMTTILPSTTGQHAIDSFSPRNWRNRRAMLSNIIPSETQAAEAVGKIIPGLHGKLHGIGYRVPLANVSLLDVSVCMSQQVSLPDLCAKISEASKRNMEGILGYTEHQIVSTDFIGVSQSCIFDATASKCYEDKCAKLVGWYDNEWAFANRMLDLILFMAKKDAEAKGDDKVKDKVDTGKNAKREM